MDAFKNFAKATVSTGYDASATSIVLSGGHGSRLPAAPFNATWYNSTDYADPTDDPNVEIVRVTAKATDTLTVTRAEEGTTATTKNTATKSYKLIAGLTAKTLNTDIGSASYAPQTINGRLTLETGVAVSLTDQTAKTTLYFTPYQGNRVSLYNGVAWETFTFSELSLPLGTLIADTNYDVFIYDNAGTLALELGAAWSSNIARASALALQDGIYVKSGATTRRYIGTIRTTSATTTEDSLLKRFVWNRANSIGRDLYYEDMVQHSYGSTARAWAGNNDACIQFVVGLAEELITANVGAEVITPINVYGTIVACLDTVVYPPPYRRLISGVTSGTANLNTIASATDVFAPQLGYHKIILTEFTFGGSADFKSGGISGIVRG